METVVVFRSKDFKEARNYRWKMMDLGVLCIIDNLTTPDYFEVRAIKRLYDYFEFMVTSCTGTMMWTLFDAYCRSHNAVNTIDLDIDMEYAIQYNLVRYDMDIFNFVLTDKGVALVEYLKEKGFLQ